MARTKAARVSSARRRLYHGDDAKDSRPKTDDEQFMETARARFKLAQDAESKQRQRELDDLRFYAGDQWPAELITQRQGQEAIGNVPPVPARPCLVINKTLQPVAAVTNQQSALDLSAELIPADDFEGLVGPIDDTEIELREGLLRRIQRDSEAQSARLWAAERAAIAGRGYWTIATKYVEGQSFDQDAYVNRVFNQNSVSVDPAHESPTAEDADWGFVGSFLPWERYKAEFPKASNDAKNVVVSSCDTDDDFKALGEEYPGWFTMDGDTRMCRVVDYYYIERTSKELWLLPDGSCCWKADAPKGTVPKATRTCIEKSVKWAKLDGAQRLDYGDWPGPDIPIIKVLGRELQPYDADRRSEGMVRPMRDSGQALNATVSKAVETQSLAPIPPWQMGAGQDEGFEQEYLLSTTRTLSTLHYNVYDEQGRQYPNMPTRTSAGVELQAMFSSIQMFGEFVKDTTLVPAASLGDIDPAIKSGNAIEQILDEAKRGISHFIDNLVRSTKREAQILNNLLYPLYGMRPGRLARIITGEGETKTLIIGQPFQPDPKGRPQPLTDAMTGQPMSPEQAKQVDQAKHYALTENASFNIAIKVTKNADTRRQKESHVLGQLIAANPSEMSIIGDKFFESLDSPGHKEMAERHKLVLDPRILAYLEEQKTGQKGNPQVQALTQQVQELQQKLQSDTAKAQIDAQTKLQIAKMESDDKRWVASLQWQTTGAIGEAKINQQAAEATLNASSRVEAAVLKESGVTAKVLSGQAHEAGLAAMQNTHDRVGQIIDHAHEAALVTHQAVTNAENMPPPIQETPNA